MWQGPVVNLLEQSVLAISSSYNRRVQNCFQAGRAQFYVKGNAVVLLPYGHFVNNLGIVTKLVYGTVCTTETVCIFLK